jgi:16S rRNA (guanine(966)-N(2))-methyltransferase RsmD
MRIIAGEWKGRSLHVPRDADFRPTTDRVKEALFNILSGVISWRETRVCDLYAGSGGLGLEALSRGALHATFIEMNQRSLTVLHRNLGIAVDDNRVKVQRQDVRKYLRRTTDSFDLVFADPPYADLPADGFIDGIAGILNPGGHAVIEHAAHVQLEGLPSLPRIDQRRYGTTTISIFQSNDGEDI